MNPSRAKTQSTELSADAKRGDLGLAEGGRSQFSVEGWGLTRPLTAIAVFAPCLRREPFADNGPSPSSLARVATCVHDNILSTCNNKECGS